VGGQGPAPEGVLKEISTLALWGSGRISFKSLASTARPCCLPLKFKMKAAMENVRSKKGYKVTVAVIWLLLVGFTVLVAVQFIEAVSTHTLLITGGIILSWGIWKFLFKLVLLLLQVAIFFYVIYLLIA
jgi:hypothetical protein